MSKIDTTKIEGYENMSPEEKLSALESFEFDDAPKGDPDTTKLDAELQAMKKARDKAFSEVAEYKKQLKAKLTQDEQDKIEREEQQKALQEELETLRRERTVSGYSQKLVSMGYDVETANKMAESLPNDVKDDFFEAGKTFLDNMKQQIKNDNLNAQPKPTSGTPIQGDDQEKAYNDKLRRFAGL